MLNEFSMEAVPIDLHHLSIIRWFLSKSSPVDEVWNTLTAVLNFGVLKRIQTPHSLLNFILGFWSR